MFDGATAKDAAVQGVWAAGFIAGFLVIAGLRAHPISLDTGLG
jgi:hypothetical protein